MQPGEKDVMSVRSVLLWEKVSIGQETERKKKSSKVKVERRACLGVSFTAVWLSKPNLAVMSCVCAGLKVVRMLD